MHRHHRAIRNILILTLLFALLLPSVTAFIGVNMSSNVTVTTTNTVVTIAPVPARTELTRALVPRPTITALSTKVPVNPVGIISPGNTSTGNQTTVPLTPVTVETTFVTRQATTAPVTLRTIPVTSAPARLLSPVQTATPSPVPTVSPSPEPTISPAIPNTTFLEEPSKNLPLSGIVPDELAPVAAAGLGIALTGLAALFSSPLNGLIGQLVAFLKTSLGGMVSGRVASEEKGHRQVISGETEPLYLGFSQKELLVLVTGALLVGGLFLFADRKPFEPVMITIYVIMGGIALVLHEIAHWYYERKFSCRTEIQFWGIGTIIMVLTAWLFGNVFSQPFLTIVQSHTPREKRSVGLIMLSGPMLSVLVACACLVLVPMGGLFATAGWTGFIMNLTTGVFELLPVTPCEGKDIFSWNRLLWLGVFLPLFGFYLLATI